jgi:serine/threonine protein kinase
MDSDDVAKQPEPAASPSSVFSIGHRVAGRYAITRFIGSGGASEVYEVLDGGLGVRVALKVLNPVHAKKAVHLERFRREIQTARRVTHRNVCRIFDLGVERVRNVKRFFLTMELLNGGTLAEELQRGRRYPPEEALPIVIQLAEGLQAAHDAGVVHRDLKPGNVMLVPGALEPEAKSEPPRAVITDFGLAVSDEQTRLTRSDEFVGTPDYMAPEQSEPDALTPAADIYALGLLIYEMLTATRPFPSGPTPLATVLLRKEVPPRPLHTLVPGLDRAWEITILRCLQPRPSGRFPQARDIIASLT